MTAAATHRRAIARTPRPRRERPRRSAERPPTGERSAPPEPLELETLSASWQEALDAAERALRAARGELPGSEVGQLAGDLQRERRETALLLDQVADVARPQPSPWLAPVPVTNAMLGLPSTVRACLFDVEGVLTDSALLHAWAWAQVFDDFLRRLSEKTEWHFIPFDRVADYRAYVDGRSRLEGVHAFLGSRGIHVPEGRPDDLADADTAHALAKRKGKLLERRLRERGVTALPGARRYLEAARRAHLERAVVSASANTFPMLERAGLAALVDARVDAAVIRAEGLRSRPAPDLLLAACRRLDVSPSEAVTLTHSAAGVAAGRAAGLTVIGLGHAAQAELLGGFGAEILAPSLEALLDPRLVASEDGRASGRPE